MKLYWMHILGKYNILILLWSLTASLTNRLKFTGFENAEELILSIDIEKQIDAQLTSFSLK